MKRAAFLLLILSIISMVLICGCGEKEGADKGDVYAKIGDKKIFESDFNSKLEELSPFAKSQFSGLEGKKNLLERMIEEEILYKAALDKGYEKNEEVVKQIESIKRNTIIREFYKNEVQDAIEISDEEIAEKYKDDTDRYKEKSRVKVRQIVQKTKSDANRIINELNRGKDFNSLAKNKSVDKTTARREGLLGTVISGGYIPTIGKNEEIQEVLFALEEGQISEPEKTDKGWHVFKIEEKRPERIKPLEEVKEMIRGELKREKLRTAFEDMKAQLKEQYHVEIFEENLAEEENAEGEEGEMGEWKLEGDLDFSVEEVEEEPQSDTSDENDGDQSKLGIDELFKLASDHQDLHRAIRIYEDILKRFPEHEQSYKAQFMIGFVYSEQLGDTSRAIQAFEKVMKNYPSCDLSDDARFMIDDLRNKKEIVFEEKKIALQHG
jgi:peptidyl-prolyl cis-trans isomerase C